MTEFQPSKLGLISAILQSNVDKKSKPDEPAVELCNYTDVYYNDTITADLDFMKATASPDQIERLRLSEGDVIITKDSETADDIGIPAYVESTHDSLICGYHLTILRAHPQKAFPKFLYYSMLARETGEYWEKRANGVTRVSIPQQVVSSLTIPLPDLETQHRIADYLDKEISEMDALIAELEALVTNLQSRKVLLTARITSQDESGKKYPTYPIGLLFGNIGSGTTPRGDEWYTEPSKNGIPWVTTSELREISITETKKYVTQEAIEKVPGLRTHPAGSILIAMYGATIGRFGRLSVPASCNQACCVLSNPYKIDPDFFYSSLWAKRSELILLGSGGGQPNISQDVIRRFEMPVPPIEEQRRKAKRLEQETSEMDSLIEESTQLIENLKARKTALITEVVTGRKEV